MKKNLKKNIFQANHIAYIIYFGRTIILRKSTNFRLKIPKTFNIIL